MNAAPLIESMDFMMNAKEDIVLSFGKFSPTVLTVSLPVL